MGTVELSEIERKVIPNCDIIWDQRMLNNAKRILSDCETEEEIKEFFKECNLHIKNPEEKCRLVWNIEIKRFSGNEFGYVIYYYSDILKSAVKMAMKIDTFDQNIVIGPVEIANKKESKKLEKHIAKENVPEEEVHADEASGEG